MRRFLDWLFGGVGGAVEASGPGVLCPRCGADWGGGEWSDGCETCGGGGMARGCAFCEGACGARWQRAVVDSMDEGTAHWLGRCAFADWLDAAALPEIRHATYFPLPGPTVTDPDGTRREFATPRDAFAWLSARGYVPALDAVTEGLAPPGTCGYR